jgi:hypothetical protein
VKAPVRFLAATVASALLGHGPLLAAEGLPKPPGTVSHRFSPLLALAGSLGRRGRKAQEAAIREGHEDASSVVHG